MQPHEASRRATGRSHKEGWVALLIASSLSLAGVDALPAQDSPTGLAAFIGWGFGHRPPTEFESEGFLDLGLPDEALLVEGMYWRGAHLVAIRQAAIRGHTNGQDVKDLGVLYGRTVGEGAARLALAGGIAYVSEKRLQSGTGTLVQKHVLGLPLEAGASIGSRFIGIGLKVFGNVNSAASFFGATFGLQLGRPEPDGVEAPPP